MSEQPLISIIMPSHNAARFIAEAIESVQKQTWAHWELLVLDDASTDGTADVVTPYQADARIRYIRLERVGHPAGVRNAGLKIAKGDLIGFLDSDDAYLPDALEAMATALMQNPTWHTVRGFQQWMNEAGEPISGNYALLPGEQPGTYRLPEDFKTTYEKLVLSKNIVSVLPAMLMRREAFEAVGLLNESLTAIEDYEYYVRLYLHDFDGFGVIPNYIYRYRVYAASLTQDKSRYLKNIESGLKVMDWLFAHPKLPAECQQLKSQAYGRRYQIFARYQLNNGNKAIARDLLGMALKNKNVSPAFFAKQLFPLYVRSLLPSSLNKTLVQTRWMMRHGQHAAASQA